MELSTTFIAELVGLALVFIGIFKLDSINKSLGQLSEFAKTAAAALRALRNRSHDLANRVFIIETRLDSHERKQQDKQDS